ncbi:MAG: FtsQ-type POTRA domain-containing protein [Gammaproteobacteria bacterium]
MMVAEAMTFVRRVQPRHWLRWMLAAGGVALAWALIAHYTTRSSGPVVNAVVIRLPANREVSAAQIRSAVASAVHGGVLTVDLGAVRAAVQQLPWVAGASVRRMWPNALEVDVRLRRPIARWGEHGLVDRSGQVFTPANVTAFAALPMLKGMPDEASDVFADFGRVQSQVRPLGLKVTGLSENVSGELRVTFASGLALVLGHEKPFGRLARFIHIAVPALGPNLERVATVDMRYPNGFAVGWKGVGDHGSKK